MSSTRWRRYTASSLLSLEISARVCMAWTLSC
jgi:hypothetical protein